MAEQVGLLGRKLGMTQVFAPDGERVPVTVIQTGPCVVVGKRTPDKDGYSALQIGFEERPARLTNRPANGFFKKAGVKPQRFVREIRIPESELEKFELGQALKPSDLFVENNAVDVTGTSKGKGYQGVMKRHHMNGTKASHGVHEFFRHGGSIGCRLTPGRVHKGKRMAGQMGNEKVTLQNLQLFKIMDDDFCILVRGAVPGPTGGLVTVKKAATREVYKRVGKGEAAEVRSKNPLKASKKAAAGR
ncbi:MAG TPA: 50S ribosomal protein L3 [Kofleriaceae bacterium]|nr:50S ribosomal protein L3 [Kofleriaceae bacterium]